MVYFQFFLSKFGHGDLWVFSGFGNRDQIEALETSVSLATSFNRLLKNFLTEGTRGAR